MKISVTKPALEWYKSEMDLQKGDFVRLYTRYGGFNSIKTGFSIGVSIESPRNMGVFTKEDGITFFVEKDDEWYFDQHDLNIDYNQQNDEIRFEYINH